MGRVMWRNRCHASAPVGACRVVQVGGDVEDPGQEEQRHVADVGPHHHGRHHRKRQRRIGEPLDAGAQHRAERAVGRGEDPAPQHRDRQRRADPRQHVDRAEKPGARQAARQHGRRDEAQHGLRRHHQGHEQQRDHQGLAEGRVGEHRSPVVQAHKLDRTQQIPAVQAQPHDDQHGQQQEGDDAEQAGCDERIRQGGRPDTRGGHRLIKAVGRQQPPRRHAPTGPSPTPRSGSAIPLAHIRSRGVHHLILAESDPSGRH